MKMMISDGAVGSKSLKEDPQMSNVIFGDPLVDVKASRDICSCWCQGWAEIHIRRATGKLFLKYIYH